MDKFAWGAIFIGLVIEGFIIWGGLNNPAEERSNILIASILPVVFIGVVLLFHFLQKGET